ncbi:family 20 glycosylhydrolase [Cutibacterium equinum]|uniref:beta-N-acetylhexosaminidase n=1 Tax=Cutibacterium equinum TaxID=3016342 RepID=A0ABY7QZP5_9ACTN|nr:family 20 glycosylhydrolase [Cutibacterium equinum]WCC80461.1 family 20 glycosylhydrolase [Cutibacterium equinum]
MCALALSVASPVSAHEPPPSDWKMQVSGKMAASNPAHLNLLPLPASAKFADDGASYTIPAGACVSAPEQFTPAIDILRANIGKAYGLTLLRGHDCPITMTKDDSLGTGAQRGEAYQLSVTKTGITIKAAGTRAAIWAVQTLTQMLGPWAQAPTTLAASPTLPQVFITDQPRYSWRGLMIDPVRSFIPVDEVKRIINDMSAVKLNTLHLHLSDDQGWRVEIDNEGKAADDTIDYAQLTERSGVTSYMAGHSKLAPSAGRTGYYTKAEFIDLVDYAARHGVGIVPEIDGPGHANAMLHAIAELNSSGSYPKPASGEDRVRAYQEDDRTTLDPGNEATYTFLSHVVSRLNSYIDEGVARSGVPEVRVPVFHIGGDEASKTAKEPYQSYMKRVSDMLTANHHAAIVWNEALQPAQDASAQLPDGSYVQHWTADEPNQGGRLANFISSKHAKVIMSHVKHAYLPQKPSADLPGPSWACGENGCTIESFYNWDPTQMSGVAEENVAGVEAALWNEHMRTEHDQQSVMFPRLEATAEVAWTPQSERSFTDFKMRESLRSTVHLTRGTSFHLDALISPWASSYAPVEVDYALPGRHLVGLLALPGATQAPTNLQGTLTPVTEKHDTATGLTPVPVAVTTEMPTAYHFTDQGRTTGRVMNSLIRVYATIPEGTPPGVYRLSLSTPEPLNVSDRTAPLSLSGDQFVTVAAPPPAQPDNPANPGETGTGNDGHSPASGKHGTTGGGTDPGVIHVTGHSKSHGTTGTHASQLPHSGA